MTPDEFFNAVRDAINSNYLCVGHAGVLEHVEEHHDGTKSTFSLRVSQKMVAFTMDRKGRESIDIIAPGMDSRNDLTVICLAGDGTPLAFVVECKNSGNPGNAQRQIECGMEFCKYLFGLLRVCCGVSIHPKMFGVAAYRPRTPPKGTTRPNFVQQGKHNVLRADWSVNVQLPLRELVTAATAQKVAP